MTTDDRPTNIYDQAVLDWCNDQLEHRGFPRNAKRIRFGYEIGCYSSWTCDYNVTATITRQDGSEVETWDVWSDVLKALPEYVEARERMLDDHDNYHGSSY